MDATAHAAADENERLKRENAELKARLADLSSIVTLLPVPIAISADAKANEIEANPAFAALLGVETDFNIAETGSSATDLPFHICRDGKRVDAQDLPIRKAGRLGQEIHDELEIVRDDGIRYDIYGTAKPLFDEHGNVRRVVGAFVDVTDRKRAERALYQSVEALRKANEELQQFAYAASHDLQEPLRTISSYAQLLERRYGGDKEASEYTAFIVEGVSRMNTLISDLLTYSRVGPASELKRAPFELANALQWALLNLDHSFRERNATATRDELPEVIANESQMTQLFQNLLSNSLKYRSSLPPLIHVAAEDSGDEWIISVRDNGVGIKPEYANHVFGVFKRLHGRDVPGTGIGLAICRKIVENHGGRIWVESDGKNGSDFRFTLPK
ncbi:MAG: ATP-binding protein [Bryobacteraceae bacterium]